MPEAGGGDLRHVALFYRDQAEYRAQILGFARAGIARGEPAFLALPGDAAILLASQLNGDAAEVRCSDMTAMGRNPARIIPQLQAFLDKHAGEQVRLVTEPIWPERSPAEICEATRHEALMNLAFSQAPVTILCAYDAARLPPAAIADARQTHGEYLADGRPVPAANGVASAQIPAMCDRPLPPPRGGADVLRYSRDLAPVRRLVHRHADGAGLASDRVADLVLAASEVAANTLSHTMSGGVLHVWRDDHEVVCDIRDQGCITDPLAGRVRRSPEARGHGLFLVNQVCDLVEIRTGRAGTTVRMHMHLH